MSRELALTPKFKRAFRKFVGRNARLQKRIEDTLMQIQEDVFAASLGTHKLSGTLEGLRACSCGYDCRIVFSIERDPAGGGEVIVLLDIGTHHEVY
jgi:mRNA interferase YafQ